MTSTPSTPMISWLMYSPPRLCAVASKPGPGCPCVATPQLASAPKPTVTTTRDSSVQYVERTERILVNSDRNAPANVAFPADARTRGAAATGS